MAPLTVSDAASRLGLSPQRVRKLLSTGQLHGQRFGPAWLIQPAEILRFSKLIRPAHRPKSKPDKGLKNPKKSASKNPIKVLRWRNTCVNLGHDTQR